MERRPVLKCIRGRVVTGLGCVGEVGRCAKGWRVSKGSRTEVEGEAFLRLGRHTRIEPVPHLHSIKGDPKRSPVEPVEHPVVLYVQTATDHIPDATFLSERRKLSLVPPQHTIAIESEGVLVVPYSLRARIFAGPRGPSNLKEPFCRQSDLSLWLTRERGKKKKNCVPQKTNNLNLHTHFHAHSPLFQTISSVVYYSLPRFVVSVGG